jgi:hypothetical protein
MKKITLSIIAFIALASFATAGTTISGTALLNATGLSGGQTGVFVIDTDGSGFGSFTLDPGTVNDASFYGSSFSVLGTKTAASVFGSTSLASGLEALYTGGVSNGDAFAIVAWDNITASAGDTYSFWTDASWTLPADTGATINFNSSGDAGTFLQLTGAASGTGTVVPEPSSYALLGGLLALGCVMLRRRA